MNKVQNVLSHDPEIFELSCGEMYSSTYGRDKLRTIKLIDVKSIYEPYFQEGKWYDIFLKAEVIVEVDGNACMLICAPYQRPVNVNGLNIMIDLVNGLQHGTVPVKLVKDARFAVKTADLPWFDKERFVFPVNDYRWRATNYTHTWNGLVYIVGQDVYYHRGEDYGAVPDKHDFVAMNDAVIDELPPKGGDGKSNAITLLDETYIYRYAHANSDYIRADLHHGKFIKKGVSIGKTGNTWNGSPVIDPHLHIGIRSRDGEMDINTYPILVQAYQEQYPDEILPVAGGFRFCIEGDTVELDGISSVIPESIEIDSIYWNFCDGSSAEGGKVKKQYPSPGMYTEEMVITDRMGRTFRDYVMVGVFRKEGSEVPYAWLNYYPMRNAQAGKSVEFWVEYRNMENVWISFGDGCESMCQKTHKHIYDKSGDYVVTLLGESNGGGPGVFKVLVKVD